MKKIIEEKFDDFPIGYFPYDLGHNGNGEHHYIKKKEYTGNWYDPINNHQWRTMGGSWLVTSDNDKKYMEQSRGDYSSGSFADIAPLLIYKSQKLEEYQVSVNIRFFSFASYAGIVFNYIHNRKYMALIIDKSKIKIIFRNQNDIFVLGEKEIELDDFKTYELKVDVRESIMVYFDNRPYISINNKYIKKGKVGLIAKKAVRFSDFIVKMAEVSFLAYEGSIKEEEQRIALKTQKNPKLELIKKIDLKDFGTGRQIRFGHIDDDNLFIVLAQHQKRIFRDAYAHISCLTAIDLMGNVLWQKGTAKNDFDNTVISADLPFQVSDIDNDGIDEVIYAYNFEIIILNGLTGEVKARMKTPLVSDGPFNRLNVDCIRIADLKGNGYQGDFIIKDRYHNVWAYDNSFKLLWHYKCRNTGHFPLVQDVNNDGKDEVFIGYDLVSNTGKLIWKVPINADHTDEIIYEPFLQRYYLASGNENFNIIDKNGKILKRIPVGHAQRISLADFHDKGHEICLLSFWGGQGILYLFTKNGDLIWEKEIADNGNVICPINYDGKNKMILMSGHLGLMDKDGDVFVAFPDDGHPTLCATAKDIDNDGIDEIILWDQSSMYIYKSDTFSCQSKYLRYPMNGESNYRGEFLIKDKK